MSKRTSLILVLGIVTILGVAGSFLPAHASGLTLNVNITSDAVDANPGDRVCETGTGNGLCSLRAAVCDGRAIPQSTIG